MNYVWKLFTADKYIAHILFIPRTERTPCRIPLVWQGILRSQYFSTLLIHSICLERKRSKAVDSFKSPVSQVFVCRGSFQKWGAQHYQNIILVKWHLFGVGNRQYVVFHVIYFILFVMVVFSKTICPICTTASSWMKLTDYFQLGYFTVKLFTSKLGSLAEKLLTSQ